MHYSCVTTQTLNEKFANRFFGQNGYILWPSCSPDFTPLDYFLWKKLKEDIYREQSTTSDNMKIRIIRICTITPETIQRASQLIIVCVCVFIL